MSSICSVLRNCLLFALLSGASLRAQQIMPARLEQYTPPANINFNTFGATQDHRGNLWFATNDGVVRFDGRYFKVFHDPVFKQGDDYFHVVPSPDGRIWCKLGRGNGLSYIDPQQDKIIRIPDTTRVVREFLAVRSSNYLFAAADSTLWIGQRGTGLLHFNPRTYAVEQVFSQEGEGVRWITQDRQGTIWFTTNLAVYAYDPPTRRLKRYREGLGPPGPVSKELRAIGIHARADGSILVGLPSEVDVIHPASGHIDRLVLTPSRFHADQTVRDFFDDGQGNTYFKNHTSCFRYTRQGQLQQLEFSDLRHRVYFLYPGRDHRLWVTAGQTLLAYDLTRIHAIPSLNLIDVVVNQDRLEEASTNHYLVRDSLGHPTLTVQDGDLISLRVSPFIQSLAHAFRIRLEGHDQNWNVVEDAVNQVAYQLSAGRYTLVLNAYTKPSGWARHVSTMTIIVRPLFWKTGWFWVLVLAVVGLVSGTLLQGGRRRQKLRRELSRREFEAATLRELDELKSRFFTNITHELRTPLTLILNAAEHINPSRLAESDQNRLQSIRNNAHQLMRLINQTLDMAKLDAGKLDHREQVGDPVAFVGQVVDQFRGLAQHRQINLDWITQSENSSLYRFDADSLGKITYNLLSNALKFTSAEGVVRIDCWMTDQHVLWLRVADTGMGIPAEHLARLFDRFYQVDSSSTRAYSGTGIGLALVKELTQWLGGTIEVESSVGRGSVFTLTLPLIPATEADQATVDEPNGFFQQTSLPATPPVLKAIPDQAFPQEASWPLVLVVEDNPELRLFLKESLMAHYRVITADNGRQGLEQALAEVPDLIVSDVMMPELDGYELVERLKADERTSHIPIVLLTARSSYDSRLKGLGAGADDYLSKPFSVEELILRIGNSLRTRQNWQRQLTSEKKTGQAEQSPNPRLEKEERFLARLRTQILAHLTDEQVDVDWLSQQAGMSRAQLHRKLTALTNMNTTSFIHSVRMSQAVVLLQEGKLNVAQVAQALGYNSQSYFSKLFQEHYGYPPSKHNAL
ncbi:signal transduction histidine kinase [Larkinella arboricola]|uniref:histidine kinase n=1 Tax=Larkinella arboricola TaxID=643671 RepID=A0A327WQ76_LARAB|nr:ATP-binding protein [Larkinella arboricola]RAJ92992.1 signal transduction histidine kinase [Larkinella arboricola]